MSLPEELIELVHSDGEKGRSVRERERKMGRRRKKEDRFLYGG